MWKKGIPLEHNVHLSSHVLDVTGTWEKVAILMERQGHHAIRRVKRLLETESKPPNEAKIKHQGMNQRRR